MSDQFYKYNLYDRAIRQLLLFTGLWPSANPSIPYRLLLLVHVLAAIVTSLCILNFCRHHFANLNLFLKGLGLVFSFCTIIQKIKEDHCILPGVPNVSDFILHSRSMYKHLRFLLGVYRKRLVELHATLALTFNQDLENVELRPILLSALPYFYRPSLILSIVTYTVIAMYWITPVIAIIIQLIRGVDIVKYILPFPAIYPWKISAESWRYPAHYAFEIYAGICLGSFTSLIDSLFGYYIFQISAQLRTLSYRVKNISSTNDYRREIRECVTRHQILTKCQRHLERIYGPIVLWMLVTSAIVMCALIYQASQMSPGKATLIVFYILMKSVQTLLYGWFGTFLTTESDMFREAIYTSDWPGSGEKCLMTDVLMMMTYKPLVVRACSLSTISVDMFVAVVNTAFSYFFMLRTLEEGSNP